MQPYHEYVEMFNRQVAVLRQAANTPDAVDDLLSEEQKEGFVKAFRELLKLKNILISFTEFRFDDIDIEEQEIEEYQSKYLDIYDSIKPGDTEKASILADLDFELELVRRDEVNVGFILRLVAQMVGASESKQKEIRQTIDGLMRSDSELRSKRELIERFLQNNLLNIEESGDVEREFYEFLDAERRAEFEKLCRENGIDKAKAERVVARYLSGGHKPRDHELNDLLIEQPRLLELDSIVGRLRDGLRKFLSTFIDGV